jgi:guanine deaminase
MQQGQQAMRDTMGQAAALTGGYGNTYAQQAGEQAYAAYLSRLNDVLPELYGEAYNRFGLFGKPEKTVMAHCVYSDDNEIARMKENGVFIAHCPASNTNVASGVAPMRKYLDLDMNLGLGSDVAGGHSESMFTAMVDALQVSRLYWRLVDQSKKPLNVTEVFYLATKGGGAFFGKVGSFEEGYECDAVILDDSLLPHPQKLSVQERLERAIYLGGDVKAMKAKVCRGTEIIRN